MCTDLDFIFVITLLLYCQNLKTCCISQTASAEGELCSTFEGSPSATFSAGHSPRMIDSMHSHYLCVVFHWDQWPYLHSHGYHWDSSPKKTTLRIQTFVAPEGRLKHSRQLSWRVNSKVTRKLSEQYNSEQFPSPPLNHVLEHYCFSPGLHSAGLAVGFNYLKGLWFDDFPSYCNIWTIELNTYRTSCTYVFNVSKV